MKPLLDIEKIAAQQKAHNRGESVKVHLFSGSVLEFAPEYVRARYAAEGYSGAACGYVRKKTTQIKSEVTCQHCLRAISKPAKPE